MTIPTVVHIIPGFASAEGAGGSALFGIELVRALDRSKVRPILCGIHRFNTPSEDQWLRTLADEGIETYIMVEQPKKLRYDLARFTILMNRLIKTRQVAIIHSHVERVEFFLVLKKLFSIYYPHLVHTVHIDRMWVTRPFIRRLMNIAYTTLYKHEIAISQATKETLDQRWSAQLFRRKAILIHNSLPHYRLAAFSRPKQHQPFHPPRFIIIGRLEEQKSQQDFIDAAAIVVKQYPTSEFWIVGEGRLESDLRRRVAQLEVERQVIFLGARQDIPELLSQVDVLVSTSRWEGFATVILEGMAAQLPIIATSIQGNTEQVHNYVNGLLAKPRDPESIAKAMMWMIEHPHQSIEMGRKGYENNQQFTMEYTADQYEAIYAEIMA